MLAGVDVTPEMRLSWMDSYARTLTKMNVSPLGRVILCQIVGKQFASLEGGVLPETLPSLEKIVSDFLGERGLNGGLFRKAFKAACATGKVDVTFLDRITEALGHQRGSLEHEFIELAAGVDTLEFAIAATLEHVRERPEEEKAFIQLGRVVRNLEARHRKLRAMEGWSLEELFNYKEVAVHSTKTKISPQIEAAAMLLAGATHREILQGWIDAYPSRIRFLRGSSRREELWVKDAALLSASLETKLAAVGERLSNGEVVVSADLLELWPERRAMIKAIDAHLSPSTAWYVASTGFYKYPDDALEEIAKGLERNRRPMGLPRQFFERHKKMQAGRRDMPKLNSPTIRLFLRDSD